MSKSIKILKTLHLASFNGNIGDLANHKGAKRIFSKYLDFRFEYTNLEIRDFYWKKKQFNKDFIDYANQFDLLIIGGGNYFELWVENSSTGTSIDIELNLLRQLKIPTIFYSLGVDIGQGCSKNSARRFNDFLKTIIEQKNLFFCVRNDGSKKALKRLCESDIFSKIPIMPDGGFFASEKNNNNLNVSNSIGINIAGDMLNQRFNKEVNKEYFINGFKEIIEELCAYQPQLKIYFIAHIWKDLILINDLFKSLKDEYLRKQVFLEKLEPNINGLNDFLDSYTKYDLVLGMRFHANVCPIGLGTPTIGLVNYPQVKLLYEELNLEHRFVDVREKGFKEKIIENTKIDLANSASIKIKYKKIKEDLNIQAGEVMLLIENWMKSFF